MIKYIANYFILYSSSSQLEFRLSVLYNNNQL